MNGSFKIDWVDGGLEPKCAPNPDYPNGMDVDVAKEFGTPLKEGTPTCKTDLPYPAKRCGYFSVKCQICGFGLVITTAGRPDDPRSLVIPCNLTGQKQ